MNESTVAPDLTTILLNTTTTTVRPADIDPPIRTCNYFVTSNNKTVVFDFSNNYGGTTRFYLSKASLFYQGHSVYNYLYNLESI